MTKTDPLQCGSSPSTAEYVSTTPIGPWSALVVPTAGVYALAIAEPFLTELKELADQWASADARVGDLECRHFFSGASAYRDASIVASLTPFGLAFKVPTEIRNGLLSSGRAAPLRYFPKAPIKRNYVLFASAQDLAASDAALLILGDYPLSQ